MGFTSRAAFRNQPCSFVIDRSWICTARRRSWTCTVRSQPRSRRQYRLAPEATSIYAVSDLHTDYDINMEWVSRLKQREEYRDAVLILAGDVSDDLRLLRTTLEHLTAAFASVCFIPGNHELWVRGLDVPERNGGARNSVEKLAAVIAMCRDLGVLLEPAKFGNVWVVPIWSWHHASWDRESDIPGVPPPTNFISDYRLCSWEGLLTREEAMGGMALAEWFDVMNDGLWHESQLEECDIISFSHFLPLQELLPEKRFLYFPNLAKAVGSDFLARRVRDLRPAMHLFGHTHFAWDATIDGVRYIQAPLCGPGERGTRLKSITFSGLDGRGAGQGGHHHLLTSEGVDAPWLPLLVYQSGQGLPHMQDMKHGGMPQPLKAEWSDYYERHPRQPQNVELAPWVAARYSHRIPKPQPSEEMPAAKP
eukprot:jgi/Botrbrau1/22439/Bobra.0091s0041.1